MCRFQLIAVFLGLVFWSCEDNSSSPPLPVPQIISFEPPGAIEGSEVTITGSDLENVVSVTVGGAEAVIKSISEGQIVFILPTAHLLIKLRCRLKTISLCQQKNFLLEATGD